MEKEVKTEKTANPKKDKKIEFVEADKLKQEDLQKVLPKELRPTKRTSYIFGAIFLIVVIIGFLQFPFGSLLSGKTDIQINIGLPWHFFVFDMENAEAIPIKFLPLIIDMIIYLILAYLIDVAASVFLNSSLSKGIKKVKSKKESQPELYNVEKETEQIQTSQKKK